MTVQRGVHPSAEVLKAFGLGKLNDSSSEVVMSHLDQCEDCRKEVASLSGDDFLHRLRRAQGLSSTAVPAKAAGHAARAPQPPASQTPPSNLPPELAANQQYEILRELGRGGMGVVYLAKNKLMDRLEVLKVVNKTLLDHPGAVERFLREIRAAAKLNHANVVAAYSALQMGELLAFAMEYVEGQDLASVVKSQGPLPVPHACFYVQQAAHGLQHAYEKGMVHRDIKPQNLILAREGKKHIVKVLDFGLAKATREKKDDTGLTGEGKMLGTPDYIAPEQTLDAAHADIRADIYSLGCTLYYLLSGHPPFSANSLGAMLLAHQSQEAKPLNLVRPEVPEELAAVVRRMMTKTPAKRYQTPLEVVQALSHFVKQGATPKPSPELSSGVIEVRPVVKKTAPVAPPPPPAAPEAKKQPEPVDVWGSLTEGSVVSAGQGKSAVVRKPRAATVRARTAKRKWLIGGSIGVGLLLLALLGMWAGGVLKVRTSDGTIVVGNVPADAEVQVEGQTVTLSRNGDVVTVTHVPKGPHRLKVVQGGREIWSSDVTVRLGGDPIRLKCERVVAEPRPPIPPPEPKPPVVTHDAPTNPDTNKPDVPRVAGAAGNDKDFVSLFNGRDLTGWSVDQGDANQWSAEDNAIVGRSKHWTTLNYLLTDKEYADFILRFDYKVEDDSHGGVAIRAIEGERLNVGNRHPLHHPLIKLTKPAMGNGEMTGTTHWLKSAAINVPPVEDLQLPTRTWHSMEVIVKGDNCTATVGGKKVVDVTLDPDPKARGNIVPGLGRRKGKVGFQINTGTMRYRNIKIKELLSRKAEEKGARKLFRVRQAFNGKWSIVDDHLEQTSFDANVCLYFGDPAWKDYDFAVDVMRVAGNDQVCQLFRLKEGRGAFFYGLGHLQNSLFTIESGRQRLGSFKGHVEQGEWYKMLVRSRGKHMQCFLNDATIFDFESDDHPSGCVGLRTYWTQYRFRNIKVTAPDGTVLLEGLPDLNHELPDEAKAAPIAANDGFVPLFDDKDLTGWEGLKKYWNVQSGALVGYTSEDPKHNTFLCSKKKYGDFELKFKVRLKDGIGNSGVQIRSKLEDREKFIVSGPQCDMGANYWGSLYGEGKGWGYMMKQSPSELVKKAVKPSDFNDYYIKCVGKRVTIKINDETMVDGDFPALPDEGIIAWQLHAGPPMEVTFKDIQFTDLGKSRTEVPAAPRATQEKGFVPLFNRKDKSGWKTHPRQRGNWRVEKGILIGSGPTLSHLYTVRGNYKNFRLVVEARINDGGNSGIYFRAPFGPLLPPNNPMYLQGYEAQINANSRDPRKTGSLIGMFQVSEAPHKPNEWFTLEVIAQGNHIVIKVNDKTTADYPDDKRLYTSGHIALQQLDATTVVEFRRIEIKELK